METTRTERVRVLLKYFGIPLQKFAEMLGVSQSTLSSQLQRNSLTQDTLDYILLNYPDVNPYWLLFGQGEMFTDKFKNIAFKSKDIISDITENTIRRTRSEWESSCPKENKDDYADRQQKMIDQLIQLGIDSQSRMIRINEIVDKLAGVCESFAKHISSKECECASLRREVANVHELLSEIVRNMCHTESKHINFHETRIENQNI